MKRAGFTMIELIFVIVILGILAAVAVPKLAATRNDAKVSAEISSAKQTLTNLGAEYTAAGAWTTTAAEATNNVKCFTFTNLTADGNVTVTATNSGDTTACPAAVLTQVTEMAEENGLINSDGTAKTHSFGGTSVVR